MIATENARRCASGLTKPTRGSGAREARTYRSLNSRAARWTASSEATLASLPSSHGTSVNGPALGVSTPTPERGLLLLMPERITGVALLAACLACGGSSTQTTTNQVNGTIGSEPFVAKDAISATGSWKGFSFSGTTLAVDCRRCRRRQSTTHPSTVLSRHTVEGPGIRT